MPSRQTDTKLDKLLKQKEQLEARIKAEAAKLRAQTRKDDTRRKIIAGALVLEHVQRHPDRPFAKELAALLDHYAKRPADRALFDLPETPGTLTPDPASTSEFTEPQPRSTGPFAAFSRSSRDG